MSNGKHIMHSKLFFHVYHVTYNIVHTHHKGGLKFGTCYPRWSGAEKAVTLWTEWMQTSTQQQSRFHISHLVVMPSQARGTLINVMRGKKKEYWSILSGLFRFYTSCVCLNLAHLRQVFVKLKMREKYEIYSDSNSVVLKLPLVHTLQGRICNYRTLARWG